MRRRAEVETLELGDGARGLVDRVGAKMRHRTVRGDALEAGMELDRALVPDVRIVGGRLADEHRTRFAEELRAGEMLRTDAAALLRGGEDNDDAWCAVQLFGKRARRQENGSHAGLHVGRTAS